MNTSSEELLRRYQRVRRASVSMCEPLMPEDYQVQPMEEVSPPKWNLGHTSWFFWHFMLKPAGLSLPVDEAYSYLLNSYYHRAGLRGLRGRRGLISRPTTEEIYRYRSSVDERMEKLLGDQKPVDSKATGFLISVGTNHEQQHQELFFTEIKNIYFANERGLRPAYLPAPAALPRVEVQKAAFVPFAGGTFELGNTEGGWCWDNELGTHRAFLRDYALQNRLVTNGEFLEFMEDGGYSNSVLWLSDGWREVEAKEWEAPLYWEKVGGIWRIYKLCGTEDLNLDEPVCHVSFYEAWAFARWKSQTDQEFRGARLPTEREWEHAARASQCSAFSANLVESGLLHPAPPGGNSGALEQMLGDVWEWTSSHYEPYPEFEEFPNDLSEYNGKFMNNQRVLRGGSCVTPGDHIRISYRNFWHPATRFQFTGIRLARDLS